MSTTGTGRIPTIWEKHRRSQLAWLGPLGFEAFFSSFNNKYNILFFVGNPMESPPNGFFESRANDSPPSYYLICITASASLFFLLLLCSRFLPASLHHCDSASIPVRLSMVSPPVLSAQPAGLSGLVWSTSLGWISFLEVLPTFDRFLTGRELQFPRFPDHTATYLRAQGDDSFHLTSYIPLAFDEPRPSIYQPPRLAAPCTNYLNHPTRGIPQWRASRFRH